MRDDNEVWDGNQAKGGGSRASVLREPTTYKKKAPAAYRVTIAYRELVCIRKRCPFFPKDTALHQGSWLGKQRAGWTSASTHLLGQVCFFSEQPTELFTVLCMEALRKGEKRRGQGWLQALVCFTVDDGAVIKMETSGEEEVMGTDSVQGRNPI